MIRTLTFLGEVKGQTESGTYVHDFYDTPPYGNWTLVEKPMLPVYLNQSQIPVGSNWTVVSPLRANHTYHTYLYGEWIDQSSKPATDYDVYAYNPHGVLESYHTESAGLPEHLGTTVDQPFFTPKLSGNYSFVLRNDPRESNASQQATFMTIENVECNEWQEVYVEGKENDVPVFNTSWAFEFVTDSQHIEVFVRVPETLDMYEARLYLMANPKAGFGETLNGVPLAWEDGLYGKIDKSYGGYNLESKEPRGQAYASSEFYGQDMYINYTSPVKGKSLYHIVFIGEKGAGTINFLVKTQFGHVGLDPVNAPLRASPNNETSLIFASNATDLTNASLNYSANNWADFTAVDMELTDNRTCSATVPGQPAGTILKYEVNAADLFENRLTFRGNYTVKYSSQLDLTLKSAAISIGENVTLTGFITPPAENITITLVFTSANGTIDQHVHAAENGTFIGTFRPATEGTWMVQATFQGNEMLFESLSQTLRFKVDPPSFLSRYSTFIFAGFGAGAGAVIAAVVYIKKFRQ
jgi:hypothetical protein